MPIIFWGCCILEGRYFDCLGMDALVMESFEHEHLYPLGMDALSIGCSGTLLNAIIRTLSLPAFRALRELLSCLGSQKKNAGQ